MNARVYRRLWREYRVGKEVPGNGDPKGRLDSRLHEKTVHGVG